MHNPAARVPVVVAAYDADALAALVRESYDPVAVVLANVSDFFTKPMGPTMFMKFKGFIGMDTQARSSELTFNDSLDMSSSLGPRWGYSAVSAG